jgi:hypothetical protein
MAAETALANRQIVSLVLHHLSEMKYKDRRQGGPDQPVELLEFRPTLVPSILVNKLWADESTSILWKRYPHLPALERMHFDRQQWYANKVEKLFVMSPSPNNGEDFAYLEHLKWPSLRSLELEADWTIHGPSIKHMLHPSLEHLEVSGKQNSDSSYMTTVLLPTLLGSCRNLRSIHIGPDTSDSHNLTHNEALIDLLDANPNIKDIRIISSSFPDKDLLFRHLSKRPGLEALGIDLDPGLRLLPFLQESNGISPSFSSLRRLNIMCYPEIALALSAHLPRVEQLSMDIARIPDEPAQIPYVAILSDLLNSLVRCKHLQLLKVNVGQLAMNFPSTKSLPTLTGESLVGLADACSNLKELTLLASEPAAIDASSITSAQFEQFCQRTPGLVRLSLKLHPGTAIHLEETALQTLGRYCRQLEVLRLKISVQLPSLTAPDSTSPAPYYGKHAQDILPLQAGGQPSWEDTKPAKNKSDMTHNPTPVERCFPRLTHLAVARSQTVLSITASTYAASSVSQSSSTGDPSIEEELVRVWAQSLVVHFPRLDILEAWGDWTGHDNDSLNYFLPLEEPLASTWEFLSGLEQDLWDDGQDVDVDDWDHWVPNFDEIVGHESRGSGDWERASLVNEFPNFDIANNEYLHAYEEEPEDMVTPIDDREKWFAHTDSQFTAAYPYKTATHTPERDSMHQITYDMEQSALHSLRRKSQ